MGKMKKILTIVLLIVSYNLFGQTNLMRAQNTPILNGDSLSQILIDNFVRLYNTKFNTDNLLENRYQYICATFDYEVNGSYYVRNGLSAIEEMNEIVSLYLKQNRKEQGLLEKSKRRVKTINIEDLAVSELTWDSGHLTGTVRSLEITVTPKIDCLQFESIYFTIHFYS
jgi:hypothetical protein